MLDGTMGDWERLWTRKGDRVYLNTATYGLPPQPVIDAVSEALEQWQAGDSSDAWDEATEGGRRAFARLMRVAPEAVAVAGTTSQLVGLIAAAVPNGARVLIPDGEFTSLLFPWLVQESRGVQVVTAPVSRLPEAIDGSIDVVALSAVQSADGAVADLDAVLEAVGRYGAWTLVNATQACGWMPLDAGRFDAVVCSAYKWLMAPRGTALCAVSERLLDVVRPLAANWFASENADAFYGMPLRLAETARRLDTSPAWFCWVGARAALELVEQIGVERIRDHDLAMANRFRAGLALPASNSAIVSVEADRGVDHLQAANIVAAERAGRVRLGFHVYNTPDDVDRALEVIRPLVSPM